MLPNDNNGKTSTGNDAQEIITEETKAEAIAEMDESVQKALDDIAALRKKAEALREKNAQLNQEVAAPAQPEAPKPKAPAPMTEAERKRAAEKQAAIIAAQKAIIAQAKKDAEAKAAKDAAAKARQEATKELEQRKLREIQRNKDRLDRKLEKKQQELRETERKIAAREARRKIQALQAEKKQAALEAQVKLAAEAQRQKLLQIKEIEERYKKQREELERRRLLLAAQKAAAQKKIKEQHDKEAKNKAIAEQKAYIKKEQEFQREEERKIKKEKEIARRLHKEARTQKSKEERAKRAAFKHQQKLAKKAAELGGGVIDIHGTTINTEIKPVASFSLGEFLGMKTKAEKTARHESDRERLKEEREAKRESARAAAAQLSIIRRQKFQNSKLGKTLAALGAFAENHKNALLTAFAGVVAFAICGICVFNYVTVYEYSYNGTTLGYVEHESDVTEVADVIQQSLSEDKDATVVIGARNGIDFKRIISVHQDFTVDTPDDVLRRLTYLGDLNVKAYGIYVDGKKIGSVEKKEDAAEVMTMIKDKYISHKKGAEVEEAIIMEDIEIKKANTKLSRVYDAKNMVNLLCTSGKKETVHTVKAGETLADIATSYNVKEKSIIADNNGINPKKLEVGSALVIKQDAPRITVKVTEKRTYDKKIAYKVIKKKDKDMYEGDTEVKQKGHSGKSTITDRTVYVNGEVSNVDVLDEKVSKEPVTKIIIVGTKERPPTVGDGVFIWPAYAGTYVVTSEYKWRWGRQHEGIDMGCPVGTDVLAADGGTVTYAGYMGGYGNLVIIDHQNGYETYYGHNSSLCVSTGQKVYEGEHIAEAGSTGNSTGSHIHFGVKKNGTFFNPREVLP